MKYEYVYRPIHFWGQKSIPNFGFVFTKVHKKMLVLFKIILSYIFQRFYLLKIYRTKKLDRQ